MQKRLDTPFAYHFHPAKCGWICCCMWSMSMSRELANVRDQGRHISLPNTAGTTDTRLKAVIDRNLTPIQSGAEDPSSACTCRKMTRSLDNKQLYPEVSHKFGFSEQHRRESQNNL